MARIEDIQKIQDLTDENGKKIKDIVKDAKDLDEVLDSIVEVLQECEDFNDNLENSFRYYLRSLPDVQNNFKDIVKHWDTVTKYVKDNLSDSKAYLGNITGIRNILKDIVDQVQQPRSAINEQIRGLRNIRDLAIRVTDSLYAQGALEDKNLVKNASKAQALEREYKARIQNLTGGSLERKDLEARQRVEEQLLKNAERELAYHVKKGDYSKFQLRQLREQIDQHKLNIEYLRHENLLTIEGLTKNAELIKNIAREESRRNPLASIAAKVGNKFGMPEIGEYFKDYKQTITQKRVKIEELKSTEADRVGTAKIAALNQQNRVNNTKYDLDKVQSKKDVVTSKVGTLQKSLQAKKSELEFAKDDVATQRILGEIEDIAKQLTNCKLEGKELKKQADDITATLSKQQLELSEANNKVEKETNAVAEAEQELQKSRKSSLTLLKESLTEQIKTLGVQGIAAALALKIWNSFKAVNEEAAELKRRVGSWEMGTAAVNNQLATSVDWLKAATELSDQTGLNVVTLFSPDDIARMAELKNLTGMSAQEAGNLAVRSKLAGVGMDQYRDALTEGANKGNALNHSVVTLKEVQEGVLKASDATSLSYGNNAKALGQAVVAAKNLGMELAGIENISKQLISFESSISAEMEAQLLTGQRLNLAKAREYALNNDLEGVANEIQKQGVNAAKFSHMNLIQQEAMAKALGMSREELAKSLVLRELNNGASKEAIAAATGMKKEQIEALSVQQNWKILLDKITQAFAPILEVLVDIMKPVSWILAGLGKIIGWISQGVGWVFRLFGLTSKITGNVHDAGKQVTFWQGAVGVIIAIAGALIGLNKTLKGTSLLSKGLAATWKGIQAVKTGVAGGAKGLAKMVTHPMQSFRGIKNATKHKAEVLQRAKNISKLKNTKGISDNVVDEATNASKDVKSTGKGLPALGKGIAEFFEPFGNVTKKNIGTAAACVAVLIPLAPISAVLSIFGMMGKVAEKGLPALGRGIVGFFEAFKSISPEALLYATAAAGIISLVSLSIGGALYLAAPAIEAFGKVIKSVFSGIQGLVSTVGNEIRLTFKTLESIDWSNFKGCGKALISLAGGISVLGLSLMLLGPAKLLKLTLFTVAISKLGQAASGVSLLARSIVSLSASIETLDVEKLNSLNNVKLGKISRAANRIESAKIKEGSKETKESESIRPATRESIETTADLKDIKNTLKVLTKLVETIDPQWDWVKFRQAEVKFFND